MSRGVESRPRKRSRPRRSDAGTVALALPPDVRLYVSPESFRNPRGETRKQAGIVTWTVLLGAPARRAIFRP